MTLTTEAVDALRARLDAEPEPPAWAEPMYAADPDDDNTAEVDIPPLLTPDDDRRDWLTLPQWEDLDRLAGLDPRCEVDATAVWVPWGTLPLAWLTLTETTRTVVTVFTRGLWFEFDTINLGD